MMTLIWKEKWKPLKSTPNRSSLGLALTTLTSLDPNPDPILRAHRSEQIFLGNGLGKCSRGNDAVVAVEPHLSRLRFRLLLLRSTTLLLRAPLLQSRSSPKGFGFLSLSAFVLLCEKILIQKFVGVRASSSQYGADPEANARGGCWKLASIHCRIQCKSTI